MDLHTASLSENSEKGKTLNPRTINEFVLPCGAVVTRGMDPSDLISLPCGQVLKIFAQLSADSACDLLRVQINSGQVDVALATYGCGSEHDLLAERGFNAQQEALQQVYYYLERELRRKYAERAQNIKTGKKLVGLDPVLSVLFLDEDYDLHDELFAEPIDEMECPCENMGTSCTNCHVRMVAC